MAKHAALRPRSINEWRKVPALSPPWPILARRLTLSGVNPEVRLQGKRVLIRRIDKAKELKRGHAKRSKFKTPIISSITVAAILIITAIPMSSPKKPADTRGKRIVENVCGIDSISAQLLGREPLTAVTLGESSVLGGVSVGTIECGGARYRYALGLNKPERILSVSRLDT